MTDDANQHVASNTQGKRKLQRAQDKGREQRTPVAVRLETLKSLSSCGVIRKHTLHHAI